MGRPSQLRVCTRGGGSDVENEEESVKIRRFWSNAMPIGYESLDVARKSAMR